MKNEITKLATGEILLWDVHQTAEATRLSVQTIYIWVSQRRIPFVKVGRRTLFDPKDIKAWIESKKVEVNQWNK